jgi:hypothetical protein
MACYQFEKPPEINPLEVEYEEAYKRKMQVFSKNHIRAESDFMDIPHMNHAVIRSAARPEHVKTYLVGITRTKIGPGQFEDKEGNIVQGVDEGLSVSLYQVVADEKSIARGNPPDEFPLSTDSWIVGRYERPRIKMSKDARGNITDAYPIGSFDC